MLGSDMGGPDMVGHVPTVIVRSRVATLFKISFGVDKYSTVKPLRVMFKRKGPFLLKNICVTFNILS